jgi:sugar transferase (PEP-CTERM/EpsH1 system associated)
MDGQLKQFPNPGFRGYSDEERIEGDALRVLIVSAQFPYPPRSGFATRVYQLARQLASRHEVTLLSYVGQEQTRSLERLRNELRVEVVELPRGSRTAKRAGQVLSASSRKPFACRAVYSHAMQQAIDDLCSRADFDLIQIESSLLCVFRFPANARLVLDEHNIEYEVFERMHEGERSLARRAFYRWEAMRFRTFEQRWWQQAAGCVVTSEREATILRLHSPETPTAVVPNGVDLDFFRPSVAANEPYTVVFNGLLDYRPNLDAALYLVDEIWPLIRKHCRQAQLLIVGRGDAADLRRLQRDGVLLTGEVPDVRPYLERAAVVLVPIRMGGGTRLKVVEGLAMGKAMVSTTLGCEGIAVRDGEHLAVADTAGAFAASVVRLLQDPSAARALGLAGRALMEDAYSWELAGARLESLYGRVVQGGGGHSGIELRPSPSVPSSS